MNDELGSRLPSNPPINPLIAESFERLADAVDAASLSGRDPLDRSLAAIVTGQRRSVIARATNSPE